MPEIRFTSDEIARFVARFETLPGVSHWSRRSGAHGEDVIELAGESGRPALKIAKSAETYAATGFDGWGLVVCDSFDELLEVLSSYQLRSPSARTPDRRPRAA